MTFDELKELLKTIQRTKCETQFLELKSANIDCPKKLFDTLSSFSNQDDGGIIVFGIDEEHGYKECGVYDPQDLQKKVNEQCLQMEPKVRPLMTVLEKDEKSFVAAEIPGIDIAERPCYYRGKGRLKGSYTRIGDSDEPMTEYEVYSYEAFRRKYQDDIRPIARATLLSLDQQKLGAYIEKLKDGKPHLSAMEEESVFELMSIKRNEDISLMAVMLFSPYPQAYCPQLCITAVVVPGTELGAEGSNGERFLDNHRIEGTIPEMLEASIAFVRRNMRTKTIVNPETGKREDRTDYPITAIREAVLNSLVHRDYSIHTEGMPIQILMFDNRIEIHNPGGIYGRIKADQLGKVQPDTRNPVLATALEVLRVTENRYSGIPTIRRELKNNGLPEPVFEDRRGHFSVTFFNSAGNHHVEADLDDKERGLIEFCKTPRTRKEIADYLGLGSISYVVKEHIMPLVDKGVIKLSIPNKPRSSKQLYFTE
ncbi:MAG: putative DNA binding domain-containing protein [Mogibacterium sp.]|nr:putative DNA binding domain-containing protein [Mogibacterium sp.]